MAIQLKNVRTSFFNGFEASSYSADQEKKFSSHFLFERGSAVHKAVQAELKRVAEEKWGAKAEATLKALVVQDKVCLRDGDKKVTAEGEAVDGYEGALYVTASSKKRPTIVDRDQSPLTEADGRPYSGCYVNAIIDVWAQDNKFGKRINAQLMGVQFVADGESFGGGGKVASPTDFESLADEFSDGEESLTDEADSLV